MSAERGNPDTLIAVESAVMMAQRLGQDMAIMPDLSVKRLADVKSGAVTGAPLEIIRCPRIWKRDGSSERF
tara:strand:- start:2255 stop:2467 length:213 start_codon:yes stop_codon:yes gene_type:complete